MNDFLKLSNFHKTLSDAAAASNASIVTAQQYDFRTNTIVPQDGLDDNRNLCSQIISYFDEHLDYKGVPLEIREWSGIVGGYRNNVLEGFQNPNIIIMIIGPINININQNGRVQIRNKDLDTDINLADQNIFNVLV